MMCGGKNKFMVFTVLENALNLGIFIYALLPRSKLQAEFFEYLFPPTAERDGENYDLLYQNSIKNMKMTWNTRFLIFCMTCNFSKCNDFTIL